MPRARFGQFVHRTLGVGVASVVFALSFTGSFIAHGDLPATRRFACEIGSWILRKPFAGSIVVRKLDHLGFDGIDVDSAEVLDPDGVRVIGAHGIHGRFSVLGIIEGALGAASAKGISLTFTDVTVDDAEIVLDAAEGSGVRIARAFQPHPGVVVAPTPPTTTVRKPMFVALPHILVKHAWAHGSPTPFVSIDATSDNVVGSVVATEQGVSVDAERSSVKSTLLPPLNPQGDGEFHLRAADHHVNMWTDFAGRVGTVAVTAAATLTDGVLKGTLDAPKVTPGDFHSLLPKAPLAQDFAAHLTVDGPLDALHVEGQAKSGPGDAKLDLEIGTGAKVTLDGAIEVRDFDPRAIVPTAPAMAVGGDVRARAEIASGKISLDLDATTFPFVIAGQSIPGTIVRGRYDAGALRGSLDVLEPGAPLAATYALDGAGELSIDGEIRAPKLAAVTRLRGAVDGSAKLKVSGKVSVASVDARIDGELHGIGKGTSTLGNGTLHARVSGKLTSPNLEADLDGRHLLLGGFDIDGVKARATGPILAPHVAVTLTDPRWSDLKVEANVHAGAAITVDALHGSFSKSDIDTKFSVHSLGVAGGSILVRGIDVESGAGDVQGDLALEDGGVSADLHGKVDLEKLARAIPRIPTTHGNATFTVALKRNDKHRSGTMQATITDAEAYLLPLRTTGIVSANIDDDALTASLSGKIAALDGTDLASLRASANGSIPGPLVQKKSWEGAFGTASLDELSVDLDRISTQPLVVTARTIYPQVPKAAGKLIVTANVARHSSAGFVSASAEVATQKLVIDTRNEQKGTGKEWKGIDGVLSLDVTQMTANEPKTPAALAVKLSGQVADDQSALASMKVSTRGDLETLLSLIPKQGDETPADKLVRAKRSALPVDARFAWSSRPLDKLPAVIRLDGVQGTIGAVFDVTGTFDEPTGSLTVRAENVLSTTPGIEPFPVSGALSGRVTKGHAEIVGSIAHESTEVAQIQWSGQAHPLGPPGDRTAGFDWSMDGLLKLAAFPLHAIPQIASRGIAGKITGQIQAKGLHAAHPRIDVDLSIADTRVLDATLDAGQLQGFLTDQAGLLALTMKQAAPAGGTGGELRATAFPAVNFENGLIPIPDAARAQTLSVELKHFDVEPFSSLAAPVLADLRGYLDGEATISLAPPTAPGVREKANTWGNLSWTKGVLLVPQLGQTLTEGSFQIALKTEKNQTSATLSDFGLKATTGRLNGSAAFTFPSDAPALLLYGARAGKGEKPEIDGTANLTIEEKNKIPVTFEGVQLGQAAGKADMRLFADDQGINLTVAIPDLQFDLPDSERAVQSLNANPDVGVMDKQYRASRKSRPKEALPIHIYIGLGAELPAGRNEKPVPKNGIAIRHAGMDVRLSGVPEVTFTDTMRVTGQVDTLSGRVLALGKPFEVQRGYVQFDNDDPSNPNLSLSAKWEAPDGTRVFAEVTGHAHDMKVHMRSDPPRPESDVLSLVLFGRDPSQAGTQPGQTDTANLAAGTGVASTVLNSLLDPVQVFGRRLETRVDNSVARGTSIGVATEIRPNLWAQVDVSTARQQERQNSDVSEVTLDWRFIRNWSLRTTVGDRGSTAFDLVWQYRY